MEKEKSSNSLLPNEIQGIELPENFELTLDSYLVDPDSWIDYIAKIIAKTLHEKDKETITRFMDAINTYIILKQIENNPGINSETVRCTTEKLYVTLSKYVIHYLNLYNKI
jgi:hypothetical protein